MSDCAAHLVDEVLPQVPVRQWVCSLPPRLRYLLGYDAKLCSAVLAVFSDRARDRNLEVGALIRDHHFVQSLLAAWEDVEGELAVVPGEQLRGVIGSGG